MAAGKQNQRRPPKKKPSDYPQMAFRVSASDKERLSQLVSEVHRKVNRGVASDQFKVKKNELIVDALYKGLSALKKLGRI